MLDLLVFDIFIIYCTDTELGYFQKKEFTQNPSDFFIFISDFTG